VFAEQRGTLLAPYWYTQNPRIQGKCTQITLQTTCGSDGDIIVWDVPPGGEPKQLETIEGVIPSVDSECVLRKKPLSIDPLKFTTGLQTTCMTVLQFGIPLANILWFPAAHMVTIQWQTMRNHVDAVLVVVELVAVSRENWQKSFTFSDDAVTGVGLHYLFPEQPLTLYNRQ
jgi:chromosome transmission fidelity protein 4